MTNITNTRFSAGFEFHGGSYGVLEEAPGRFIVMETRLLPNGHVASLPITAFLAEHGTARKVLVSTSKTALKKLPRPLFALGDRVRYRAGYAIYVGENRFGEYRLQVPNPERLFASEGHSSVVEVAPTMVRAEHPEFVDV